MNSAGTGPADDRRLLERIRRGDTEPAAELFERYGDALSSAPEGLARVVLSSPEQVFARYGPLMEDLKKEVFRVALLDSQNGLLRDVVISEGTLSASLVHPREVFKPAIAGNAAAVLLAHNHPSGVAEPSRADELLTASLKQALALLDPALDYLDQVRPLFEYDIAPAEPGYQGGGGSFGGGGASVVVTNGAAVVD